MGKQFGVHAFPHLSTSPVIQERMGSCCINQGHPKTTSAVNSSRTKTMEEPHLQCHRTSGCTDRYPGQGFTGYLLDLEGSSSQDGLESEVPTQVPRDEVPG